MSGIKSTELVLEELVAPDGGSQEDTKVASHHGEPGVLPCYHRYIDCEILWTSILLLLASLGAHSLPPIEYLREF